MIDLEDIKQNHQNREYGYFVPRRAASWWCTLEDILWPEKKVIDKIKRRAEGFAKANIDTAINFGFHTRFDFANYFSSLHGYCADVCDQLHAYGIKFFDHYTCNLVERPQDMNELKKLHSENRHHVLLHHDSVSAKYAQYEGHMFNDICEVDVRDGSRGYSRSYQAEMFCHNNPDFLDMHKKYLERLVAEVPFDGIQVDDMCDYGGLATCGCKYCRDRFLKDYGHELPPFGDVGFWGDTAGHPLYWGNYENPVFRDWLRMRVNSIADHIKMVKKVIGDRPLMTCCSNTGPVFLNSIGLNLERLTDNLDLVMLENCGFTVDSVNWCRMDAEALQQKDIAEKMGHAPAIALSYTIYKAGGYLGWCLSRFWGVANWSSTLIGKLEDEPQDTMEIHEIISPFNNWEIRHSDLDYINSCDVTEVRLASNLLCRENGWRDNSGIEHWDKVSEWSSALLDHNLGYRIVRKEELSDTDTLKQETSPLILDGVGCISDAQYNAILEYLAQGGIAWLVLPFGTHDDKGFKRSIPLSDELLAGDYPGLVIIDAKSRTQALDNLIASGWIVPRIKQVAGDKRWAARLRIYQNNIVLHIMNRALKAVPHPETKDSETKVPVLLDMESSSSSNYLEYIMEFNGIGKPWKNTVIMSPELGDEKRAVKLEIISDTCVKLYIDLSGIKVYGVIQ